MEDRNNRVPDTRGMNALQNYIEFARKQKSALTPQVSYNMNFCKDDMNETKNPKDMNRSASCTMANSEHKGFQFGNAAHPQNWISGCNGNYLNMHSAQEERSSLLRQQTLMQLLNIPIENPEVMNMAKEVKTTDQNIQGNYLNSIKNLNKGLVSGNNSSVSAAEQKKEKEMSIEEVVRNVRGDASNSGSSDVGIRLLKNMIKQTVERNTSQMNTKADVHKKTGGDVLLEVVKEMKKKEAAMMNGVCRKSKEGEVKNTDDMQPQSVGKNSDDNTIINETSEVAESHAYVSLNETLEGQRLGEELHAEILECIDNINKKIELKRKEVGEKGMIKVPLPVFKIVGGEKSEITGKENENKRETVLEWELVDIPKDGLVDGDKVYSASQLVRMRVLQEYYYYHHKTLEPSQKEKEQMKPTKLDQVDVTNSRNSDEGGKKKENLDSADIISDAYIGKLFEEKDIEDILHLINIAQTAHAHKWKENNNNSLANGSRPSLEKQEWEIEECFERKIQKKDEGNEKLLTIDKMTSGCTWKEEGDNPISLSEKKQVRIFVPPLLLYAACIYYGDNNMVDMEKLKKKVFRKMVTSLKRYGIKRYCCETVFDIKSCYLKILDFVKQLYPDWCNNRNCAGGGEDNYFHHYRNIIAIDKNVVDVEKMKRVVSSFSLNKKKKLSTKAGKKKTSCYNYKSVSSNIGTNAKRKRKRKHTGIGEAQKEERKDVMEVKMEGEHKTENKAESKEGNKVENEETNETEAKTDSGKENDNADTSHPIKENEKDTEETQNDKSNEVEDHMLKTMESEKQRTPEKNVDCIEKKPQKKKYKRGKKKRRRKKRHPENSDADQTEMELDKHEVVKTEEENINILKEENYGDKEGDAKKNEARKTQSVANDSTKVKEEESEQKECTSSKEYLIQYATNGDVKNKKIKKEKKDNKHNTKSDDESLNDVEVDKVLKLEESTENSSDKMECQSTEECVAEVVKTHEIITEVAGNDKEERNEDKKDTMEKISLEKTWSNVSNTTENVSKTTDTVLGTLANVEDACAYIGEEALEIPNNNAEGIVCTLESACIEDICEKERKSLQTSKKNSNKNSKKTQFLNQMTSCIFKYEIFSYVMIFAPLIKMKDRLSEVDTKTVRHVVLKLKNKRMIDLKQMNMKTSVRGCQCLPLDLEDKENEEMNAKEETKGMRSESQQLTGKNEHQYILNIISAYESFKKGRNMDTEQTLQNDTENNCVSNNDTKYNEQNSISSCIDSYTFMNKNDSNNYKVTCNLENHQNVTSSSFTASSTSRTCQETDMNVNEHLRKGVDDQEDLVTIVRMKYGMPILQAINKMKDCNRRKHISSKVDFDKANELVALLGLVAVEHGLEQLGLIFRYINKELGSIMYYCIKKLLEAFLRTNLNWNIKTEDIPLETTPKGDANWNKEEDELLKRNNFNNSNDSSANADTVRRNETNAQFLYNCLLGRVNNMNLEEWLRLNKKTNKGIVGGNTMNHNVVNANQNNTDMNNNPLRNEGRLNDHIWTATNMQVFANADLGRSLNGERNSCALGKSGSSKKIALSNVGNHSMNHPMGRREDTETSDHRHDTSLCTDHMHNNDNRNNENGNMGSCVSGNITNGNTNNDCSNNTTTTTATSTTINNNNNNNNNSNNKSIIEGNFPFVKAKNEMNIDIGNGSNRWYSLMHQSLLPLSSVSDSLSVCTLSKYDTTINNNGNNNNNNNNNNNSNNNNNNTNCNVSNMNVNNACNVQNINMNNVSERGCNWLMALGDKSIDRNRQDSNSRSCLGDKNSLLNNISHSSHSGSNIAADKERNVNNMIDCLFLKNVSGNTYRNLTDTNNSNNNDSNNDNNDYTISHNDTNRNNENNANFLAPSHLNGRVTNKDIFSYCDEKKGRDVKESPLQQLMNNNAMSSSKEDLLLEIADRTDIKEMFAFYALSLAKQKNYELARLYYVYMIEFFTRKVAGIYLSKYHETKPVQYFDCVVNYFAGGTGLGLGIGSGTGTGTGTGTGSSTGLSAGVGINGKGKEKEVDDNEMETKEHEETENHIIANVAEENKSTENEPQEEGYTTEMLLKYKQSCFDSDLTNTNIHTLSVKEIEMLNNAVLALVDHLFNKRRKRNEHHAYIIKDAPNNKTTCADGNGNEVGTSRFTTKCAYSANRSFSNNELMEAMDNDEESKDKEGTECDQETNESYFQEKLCEFLTQRFINKLKGSSRSSQTDYHNLVSSYRNICGNCSANGNGGGNGNAHMETENGSACPVKNLNHNEDDVSRFLLVKRENEKETEKSGYSTEENMRENVAALSSLRNVFTGEGLGGSPSGLASFFNSSKNENNRTNVTSSENGNNKGANGGGLGYLNNIAQLYLLKYMNNGNRNNLNHVHLFNHLRMMNQLCQNRQFMNNGLSFTRDIRDSENNSNNRLSNYNSNTFGTGIMGESNRLNLSNGEQCAEFMKMQSGRSTGCTSDGVVPEININGVFAERVTNVSCTNNNSSSGSGFVNSKKYNNNNNSINNRHNKNGDGGEYFGNSNLLENPWVHFSKMGIYNGSFNWEYGTCASRGKNSNVGGNEYNDGRNVKSELNVGDERYPQDQECSCEHSCNDMEKTTKNASTISKCAYANNNATEDDKGVPVPNVAQYFYLGRNVSGGNDVDFEKKNNQEDGMKEDLNPRYLLYRSDNTTRINSITNGRSVDASSSSNNNSGMDNNSNTVANSANNGVSTTTTTTTTTTAATNRRTRKRGGENDKMVSNMSVVSIDSATEESVENVDENGNVARGIRRCRSRRRGNTIATTGYERAGRGRARVMNRGNMIRSEGETKYYERRNRRNGAIGHENETEMNGRVGLNNSHINESYETISKNNNSSSSNGSIHNNNNTTKGDGGREVVNMRYVDKANSNECEEQTSEGAEDFSSALKHNKNVSDGTSGNKIVKGKRGRKAKKDLKKEEKDIKETRIRVIDTDKLTRGRIYRWEDYEFQLKSDELKPQKGVYFDKSQKAWIGSWYEDGKQIKKRFKVRYYGWEQAKLLATEARYVHELKLLTLKERRNSEALLVVSGINGYNFNNNDTNSDGNNGNNSNNTDISSSSSVCSNNDNSVSSNTNRNDSASINDNAHDTSNNLMDGVETNLLTLERKTLRTVKGEWDLKDESNIKEWDMYKISQDINSINGINRINNINSMSREEGEKGNEMNGDNNGNDFGCGRRRRGANLLTQDLSKKYVSKKHISAAAKDIRDNKTFNVDEKLLLRYKEDDALLNSVDGSVNPNRSRIHNGVLTNYENNGKMMRNDDEHTGSSELGEVEKMSLANGTAITMKVDSMTMSMTGNEMEMGTYDGMHEDATNSGVNNVDDEKLSTVLGSVDSWGAEGRGPQRKRRRRNSTAIATRVTKAGFKEVVFAPGCPQINSLVVSDNSYKNNGGVADIDMGNVESAVLFTKGNLDGKNDTTSGSSNNNVNNISNNNGNSNSNHNNNNNNNINNNTSNNNSNNNNNDEGGRYINESNDGGVTSTNSMNTQEEKLLLCENDFENGNSFFMERDNGNENTMCAIKRENERKRNLGNVEDVVSGNCSTYTGDISNNGSNSSDKISNELNRQRMESNDGIRLFGEQVSGDTSSHWGSGILRNNNTNEHRNLYSSEHDVVCKTESGVVNGPGNGILSHGIIKNECEKASSDMSVCEGRNVANYVSYSKSVKKGLDKNLNDQTVILPQGVFYQDSKKAFCANWYSNGKQEKRYFSINKFGEEGAKNLAIAARRKFEHIYRRNPGSVKKDLSASALIKNDFISSVLGNSDGCNMNANDGIGNKQRRKKDVDHSNSNNSNNNNTNTTNTTTTTANINNNNNKGYNNTNTNTNVNVNGSGNGCGEGMYFRYNGINPHLQNALNVPLNEFTNNCFSNNGCTTNRGFSQNSYTPVFSSDNGYTNTSYTNNSYGINRYGDLGSSAQETKKNKGTEIFLKTEEFPGNIFYNTKIADVMDRLNSSGNMNGGTKSGNASEDRITNEQTHEDGLGERAPLISASGESGEKGNTNNRDGEKKMEGSIGEMRQELGKSVLTPASGGYQIKVEMSNGRIKKNNIDALQNEGNGREHYEGCTLKTKINGEKLQKGPRINEKGLLGEVTENDEHGNTKISSDNMSNKSSRLSNVCFGDKINRGSDDNNNDNNNNNNNNNGTDVVNSENNNNSDSDGKKIKNKGNRNFCLNSFCSCSVCANFDECDSTNDEISFVCGKGNLVNIVRREKNNPLPEGVYMIKYNGTIQAWGSEWMCGGVKRVKTFGVKTYGTALGKKLAIQKRARMCGERLTADDGTVFDFTGREREGAYGLMDAEMRDSDDE